MSLINKNILSIRTNSVLMQKKLLPREAFKPIMFTSYKKNQFQSTKKSLLKQYVEEKKTTQNSNNISKIIYTDFLSKNNIINCLDNTFIPNSLAIELDSDKKIGILKNKKTLFNKDSTLKFKNEELNTLVKKCLKERKINTINNQNIVEKIQNINREMESDFKKLISELNNYTPTKNNDNQNCIKLISDINKEIFPNGNTINTYLIPEINIPKYITLSKSNQGLIKRLIEHINYLL